MSARDLTTHDYRFLLADQGALERMLREIAPDSVAMRISLESRKQQVEEQIAAFEAAPTYLVETQVAFRGGPVKNDGGIEPGFVGEALGAFTESIALVGASQAGDLKPNGPVPNRGAYEMVIRNTFPGSFGFQIEREFPYGAPPEEPAALEAAIGGFQSILKASAADSDEAASKAMAETHDRAMRSVHEFLETMAKRDAYCAMNFNGDKFRFENAAEVRRSASRIAPGKVKEFDKEMVAVFQGVLPEARRVEFLSIDTGQTLSGKVSEAVEDVSAINDDLGLPMLVKTRVRQAGARKPVYTIMDWKPL